MEHPENNEAYIGLVVNAGIEQPSSVNPYLKNRPRRKKRELSVSDYVEGSSGKVMLRYPARCNTGGKW